MQILSFPISSLASRDGEHWCAVMLNAIPQSAGVHYLSTRILEAVF